MTDNPRQNPWREGMSDRGRKVLLVKVRTEAIKEAIRAFVRWFKGRRPR